MPMNAVLTVFISLISVLAGAAASIVFARSSAADAGDWLSFAGSLVGAGLAGIIAILTLVLQQRLAVQRNYTTMEVLLRDLRRAGQDLRYQSGINVEPAIEFAEMVFGAAKEVALELRASDPQIARVAHLIRASELGGELKRLRDAKGGVARQDAFDCGEELFLFSCVLLDRLGAEDAFSQHI